MDEEQKAADALAAEQAAVEAEKAKPAGRTKFKPPAVGPGNEPAAPLSVAQATQDGEQTVEMVFTKEVVLTGDDHKRVRFPIGRVSVPAHLANHWYLKANGAKRVGDDPPQSAG